MARNFREAHRLLRQEAEQGDPAGIALLAYSLLMQHESESTTEGVRLLRQAAGLGHPESQFFLGQLLVGQELSGVVLSEPQDVREGVRLCRLARRKLPFHEVQNFEERFSAQ